MHFGEMQVVKPQTRRRVRFAKCQFGTLEGRDIAPGHGKGVIGGDGIESGARDIHEEGLWIPVMKAYEEGRPNEALFVIIRRDVRTPEALMGDLGAQVCSGTVALRLKSGPEGLLAEGTERRACRGDPQALDGARRRGVHATDTRVYTVTGQVFFASADIFADRFDLRDTARHVCIDLTRAHLWDVTAVGALEDVVGKMRRHGTCVDLIGLNEASAVLVDRHAPHVLEAGA